MGIPLVKLDCTSQRHFFNHIKCLNEHSECPCWHKVKCQYITSQSTLTINIYTIATFFHMMPNFRRHTHYASLLVCVNTVSSNAAQQKQKHTLVAHNINVTILTHYVFVVCVTSKCSPRPPHRQRSRCRYIIFLRRMGWGVSLWEV